MNLDPELLKLILVGTIEVGLLLLIIGAFLAVQNFSQRRLITKLRHRMQGLVAEIKQHRSKAPAVASASPQTNFKAFINTQLDLTRAHHQSLDSDQDIVLDIDPATPPPQRAAALRYALLIAEKEALNEDEKQAPDWHALQNKYDQIFGYYEDYSNSEEDAPQHLSDDDTSGEIRHLRAVAADQHTTITTLQSKLKNAKTSEEKAEIVEELQDELNKQVRFVQESETCVKLMEDELSNANKELAQTKQENQKLSQKLNNNLDAANTDSGEIQKYKKALQELQSRYAELEEKYLDTKIK